MLYAVGGKNLNDLNRLLRPKDWEDVVGQSDVKEICRKALAEGKFPKFSIFYGPTGVGKSCIAELVARELTGEQGNLEHSRSVLKYNMAALLGKSDIVSIIDNIFKFKAITNTAVYILEVVQVLRQKEEQSPFLEELTKIPDNVYIIMCTTRISALSPELRNRAILFQLGLPDYEECCGFVDSILFRLNLSAMSPKAKEVLIKSSDYTPRSIVKHIELLASGESVSETDVSKFFKSISNMEYIKLLKVLADDTVALYEFSRVTKQVISQGHAQSLFYGFRDFLIQLLLEQATGEEEIPLTKDERDAVSIMMQDFDETKFVYLFDALSKGDSFKHDTAKDVLAAFIKVKLALTHRSVSSVVSQNAQEAVASVSTSRQNARQLPPASGVPKDTISDLTTSSNLSMFGIGDDCIYRED